MCFRIFFEKIDFNNKIIIIFGTILIIYLILILLNYANKWNIKLFKNLVFRIIVYLAILAYVFIILLIAYKDVIKTTIIFSIYNAIFVIIITLFYIIVNNLDIKIPNDMTIARISYISVGIIIIFILEIAFDYATHDCLTGFVAYFFIYSCLIVLLDFIFIYFLPKTDAYRKDIARICTWLDIPTCIVFTIIVICVIAFKNYILSHIEYVTYIHGAMSSILIMSTIIFTISFSTFFFGKPIEFKS
jgi:hypothetical protein